MKATFLSFYCATWYMRRIWWSPYLKGENEYLVFAVQWLACFWYGFQAEGS